MYRVTGRTRISIVFICIVDLSAPAGALSEPRTRMCQYGAFGCSLSLTGAAVPGGDCFGCRGRYRRRTWIIEVVTCIAVLTRTERIAERARLRISRPGRCGEG